MKTIKHLLLILLICMPLLATNKRSRGEGLYQVHSANTIGHGNIWAEFTALGFIWDSGENDELNPFAFPEINVECGLFDIASIYLNSRLLSYGWKFDHFSIGSKFTFFKNKNLILHNVGALLEYKYRYLPTFNTSIGGFHDSKGTGFTPEGFISHGSNITIKGLYDLDLIAKNSKLPFKLNINIGARLFPKNKIINYSQYLLGIGFSYSGASADVFLEYSYEGFFNSTTDPKMFNIEDSAIYNSSWGVDTSGNPAYKVWEVAFSENPMYITVGGRVRYSNGAVLYGAVPLLLSYNKNSGIKDKSIKANFPEEDARGITDGFDPWYAKWKVILKISYPIRYRQTSSELKRAFLLKKNRRSKKKIDIDERLKITDEDEKKAEEIDKQRRLEEIRKRREEIEGTKE